MAAVYSGHFLVGLAIQAALMSITTELREDFNSNDTDTPRSREAWEKRRKREKPEHTENPLLSSIYEL